MRRISITLIHEIEVSDNEHYCSPGCPWLHSLGNPFKYKCNLFDAFVESPTVTIGGPPTTLVRDDGCKYEGGQGVPL